MSRKPKYCTCKQNDDEEHNCSYEEEINDNYEFKCTCCKFCEQECRDDI